MTTVPAASANRPGNGEQPDWPIRVLRTVPETELRREILQLAVAAADTDGHPPFSDQTLVQLRDSSTPVLILLGYLPAEHLPTESDGAAPLAGIAVVSADATLELVVHPAYRDQGLGGQLLTRLEIERGSQKLHALNAWSHGSHAAAPQLAARFGFAAVRELLRMRLTLAADWQPAAVSWPEGISLRSFVPDQDETTWLTVNAAAFAQHPEQGDLTLSGLQALMTEEWFDAAGFLLAVDQADQIMGFHWTKIHPAKDGQPAIGEVYVVGISPQAQGKGLGKALTLAGINDLHGRGLNVIMLYVDADNTAAVALYQKLGFTRWDADIMYAIPASVP